MQLITEKIHESLIYDSLYGNIVEGYDASDQRGMSIPEFPKMVIQNIYILQDT